jgi:hypothetical protein
MDATEIQQRHKVPMPGTGATSGKQEDILWGPQTNHWTGGGKASRRISHRSAENECKNIVVERATAQATEETAHSLRTREVEVPTTLGTLARSPGRKQRWWWYTWTSSHLIKEQPWKSGLKGEMRGQLEKNHRGNRSTGKESETDNRRHKHSPRKRINGGTPVGYSGLITLGRNNVACGLVARRQPRDKQKYNSPYWVTAS